MALLSVIRIFVMAIFFNMFLPSGDIYSDIFLMLQTWNFNNIDSLEMSGCRACYGKTEHDLYHFEKACKTCVTKNENFQCGRYVSSINKLLHIENRYGCESEDWAVNKHNTSLNKGKCGKNYDCCFGRRDSNSRVRSQDKNILKSLQLHPRFYVRCSFYYTLLYGWPKYEFHDTCLLENYQMEWCYNTISLNNKRIKNFLEENRKNLTSTNKTGIALGFLKSNVSSTEIGAIIPVDIDIVNKDEYFYCGLLIKPKNVSISVHCAEQKPKSLQLHPRILVNCDTYDTTYDDRYERGVCYDVCLLAGKAKGRYCENLAKVQDFTYSSKNKRSIKEIRSFLKENRKKFSSTNFTGIALKFLENNHSSKYLNLRAIVPVDIDNLDKDKNFECGLFIKPKNMKIIDSNKGVDCGLSTCKMHLDYLHYHFMIGKINDLQSWQTKHSYIDGLIKVGGKHCHLLRMYSWSMAIPIIINFFFSGVIFHNDWRSGFSTKYETPFLLLLLYPQWRTLKILIRYISHKDQEQLTNNLDENDKEASFIEPFCESGIQVNCVIQVFVIFSKLIPDSISQMYIIKILCTIGFDNSLHHLQY